MIARENLILPLLAAALAVASASEPNEPPATAPKTLTNSLGMKLTWIPPGRFTMGSGPEEKGREDDESPRRTVDLTRGFYLGVTEVTQGQWTALMGPDRWRAYRNVPKDPNMPAILLSWHEAVGFCRRLSEKEGRTYRLPTEAEWEYACRAGTTTWFHWGNDLDDRYAWSSKNSGGDMHPVASLRPNPWGLFDMPGSVWEWCSDWHGPYLAEPATDPKGPAEGTARIIRGGSCTNSPWDCRSAERGAVPPDKTSGGFRILLQPNPARPENPPNTKNP